MTSLIGFMYCPLSVDWGNVAEWFSGLMTFFAAFVALYLDEIKNWLRKTKIMHHEILEYKQNVVQFYYRIPIQNTGRRYIDQIEYTIMDIIENEENRKIIPAPLNWTHINPNNITTRNILPNQVVYLDLLLYQWNDGKPKVTIQSHSISHLEDMVKISHGTTIIKLKPKFFS